MKICQDVLRRMYCDEGLSVEEIADKFDCSRSAVTYWRKRFGIPERPRVRCTDLSGKKFGRWTVLEKVQYHQRVKWKCRCECGNEAEITPTSLVRHRSTKCRKCGYVSDKFREPMPRYYWTKVLVGAKKRKLEVSVDQEYCRLLYRQQDGKCALTGVPLHVGRSVREFRAGLNTASLDRIDSSRGYIEGNVQWVHKAINNMKQGLTQEEFTAWCGKVMDYAKLQLEEGHSS